MSVTENPPTAGFSCSFPKISVNQITLSPKKRQPPSPETARTAGGSDRPGAIKAPGFSPAFSFVPRFTSRNMEICRRKWVQSLWGNLMSSCHLERTEKTGVGCLDISLHSPGKGRKRGAWARMLPRPHSPHTVAHTAKRGGSFSARWETKFSLSTASRSRY